jgi:hypothetical protein
MGLGVTPSAWETGARNRTTKGTGAMSVQPALVLDRLFTPGARLGWVFRDLRQLARPFGEPEPDPERTCEQAAAQARGPTALLELQRRLFRRWTGGGVHPHEALASPVV